MQHNFLFIIFFFLISQYSIENEFIQVRHLYPSTINEDHKREGFSACTEMWLLCHIYWK